MDLTPAPERMYGWPPMTLHLNKDQSGNDGIDFDGVGGLRGGVLWAGSDPGPRPTLFIGGAGNFHAHIDQATVAELLPYLIGFVLTGRLEPRGATVSVDSTVTGLR